mgnify:CR=1 FL=1
MHVSIFFALSNCLSFLRKCHRDLGSFANLTDHLQCTAKEGHTVFDDRKTQSCSANCLGMALIHTVKSFKYPALVFTRNTDSIVFDTNLHIFSQITR